MKRWLARQILRLTGWTLEGEKPQATRCVMIAAPHTSNWDFPLMLLFATAFDMKVTWMASLWHIVHISGLCIITAIGLFDWLFLEGKTILGLSRFARTIQELLISPILYVAIGLFNRTVNDSSL